jgi:NTE family protein
MGDDHPVKHVHAVHIRASRDIGTMAAEHVHSPHFARGTGIVGRALVHLAEGETRREADLLSYLLFDGGFAAKLIELGWMDARNKHHELCTLFASHEEDHRQVA